MNHSRRVIPRRGSTNSAEYEPLTGSEYPTEMQPAPIFESDEDEHTIPFSWYEYGIFGLLGMAMLWAW